MRSQRLDACIDHITTRILTHWYEVKTSGNEDEVSDLTHELSAIARANGHCEGFPLMDWLHRKAMKHETIETRKTTAEAFVRMAGAFPDSGEMITPLLDELGDSNCLIRAKAAAALTKLGPIAVSDPRTIPALLRCIEAVEENEGYLPIHLTVAPEHPNLLGAHLEELRDNCPPGFAKAAAIAALESLGDADLPFVHVVLWRSLGDRIWVIRALSAVALAKSKGGSMVVDASLKSLNAQKRGMRSHAVRTLALLTASGREPSVILPALHQAYLPHNDLLLRAVASEEMGHLLYVGSDPDYSTDLKGWLTSYRETGLLHSLMGDLLRRPGAYSMLKENVSLRLLQVVSGESVLPFMASSEKPMSVGARNSETAKAHNLPILLIEVHFTDHSNLADLYRVDLLSELEKIITGMCEFQRSGDAAGWFRWAGRLALVIQRDVETLFTCAFEIMNAFASRHSIPLKMSLHVGDIYLRRDYEGLWEAEGQGLLTAQRILESADDGSIVVSDAAFRSLDQRSPWKKSLYALPKGSAKACGYLRLYTLYDPQASVGRPSKFRSPAKKSNIDWKCMFTTCIRIVYILILLGVIGVNLLHLFRYCKLTQ